MGGATREGLNWVALQLKHDQKGNRYVTYQHIPEGIAAVWSTETLAKGAQGRGGTCTFSFGGTDSGLAKVAEAKAGGAANFVCDIPHNTAPVNHIPCGITAGCSTESGGAGASGRAGTGTPLFALTKSGGAAAVGGKAGWPAKGMCDILSNTGWAQTNHVAAQLSDSRQIWWPPKSCAN